MVVMTQPHFQAVPFAEFSVWVTSKYVVALQPDRATADIAPFLGLYNAFTHLLAHPIPVATGFQSSAFAI